MGTNFYRVPTDEEMQDRRSALLKKIATLDLSPASINICFGEERPDSWDRVNPWDTFTDNMCVHLGKRSGGWKFCWNFNANKHYNNRETLESFVRSGRIVDEYGEEMDPNEFLEMAYSWCPDGWDTQSYYRENGGVPHYLNYEQYMDRYVDGLRVTYSTDFS